MFAAPTGVIPPCDYAAVLIELQQLKASQSTVLQQLLALSREVIAVRGLVLSRASDNGTVGHAPDVDQLLPVPSDSWTCPICGLNLKHKESFKGHIRKLVYPSKRPGCHLNPLILQHKRLVHRFNGVNFYEQGYAFCKEFYHQTCVSCTKRDPDDVSLRHICLWLDAARSDDVDFPEYDTRCQVVSVKHRRSCSAARHDVSQSSSQSSFVSSSSGSSSILNCSNPHP